MTRLLIVDDNAVDRELARRLLNEIPGVEILEASNGALGLEAIEERLPDLVLSDIRMPEVDGLELVGECKSRFPGLPVILMTSRGSEKVAAEALQAGATSYVPKTDMHGDLLDTVQGVLAAIEARRELKDVLALVESSTSRLRLHNDPQLISAVVAYIQDELNRALFGDEALRSQVGTALAEALSNAMIHGNLEVSSDLRDEGSEPYHELIAQRRTEAPWAQRTVLCAMERSPTKVRFVIRDEGSGFDVTSLPDPTRPEGMLKARGRGLFLIHAFMDEVEYNDAGNEIRLTKLSTKGG